MRVPRSRLFILHAVLVGSAATADVAQAQQGLVPAWRFQPGGSTQATSLVGWRLVGGNNRELGRSVTVAEADVVLEQVENLLAAPHDLTFTALTVRDHQWVWRGRWQGTEVAASSRAYHRQREATYSAGQFRQALVEAVVVHDRPRRSRYTPSFGRRALR